MSLDIDAKIKTHKELDYQLSLVIDNYTSKVQGLLNSTSVDSETQTLVDSVFWNKTRAWLFPNAQLKINKPFLSLLSS